MTTLQINDTLIILNEIELETQAGILTVEKLNQLLSDNKIPAAMYAAFMKKIGAKDQITDQRALDYFKSVNSLHFVTD
jgi:hypothetical protein